MSEKNLTTRKDMILFEGWNPTGEVPHGETGPGCVVGCVYCNQEAVAIQPDGTRESGYIDPIIQAATALNTRLMVDSRTSHFVEPGKVVGDLLSWKYYDPNMNLVLQNFTDPGLGGWKETIQMMGLLNDANHQGPVMFITKLGMSEPNADKIADIKDKGLNIMSIVSYTGLPENIEPNSPHEVRRRVLQKMHERNIPAFAAMQPIIEGLNDSPEVIQSIIGEVHNFVDGLIVGGLYVFEDHTVRKFKELGIELPEQYSGIRYPIAKVLNKDVLGNVQAIVGDMGLDTPVFPSTDCAVASAMTKRYNIPTPDRVASWAGHEKLKFDEAHCAACPPEQQAVCNEAYNTDPQVYALELKEILDELEIPHLRVEPSKHAEGQLVIVGGSVPTELQFLLMERLGGLYVHNLPDKVSLRERCIEAYAEIPELSGKPFEQFHLGEFVIGHEWFIFVAEDTFKDEDFQNFASNWVRGKTRARVNLIPTNSQAVLSKEFVVDQISANYGLDREHVLQNVNVDIQ